MESQRLAWNVSIEDDKEVLFLRFYDCLKKWYAEVNVQGVLKQAPF